MFFSQMADMGHEQLVVCHDQSSGYRGIIAIHDTTLGPALGGTRFWNYKSDEEAIVDALRLVARHDVQERRGRPQPRRRQVRDHRRQPHHAIAR